MPIWYISKQHSCPIVQAFNMFRGMRKSIFQIAQFKTLLGQELLLPRCPQARKLRGCTEARTAKRTPEKPIWLQQHIGLIASWSLLGFLSALLLQQDLVLNLLHTRQSGFMDIGQVAPPAEPLSFESRIFWSFSNISGDFMLTFNYIMDICQVAHLWNLLVLFEHNILNLFSLSAICQSLSRG